MECNLENRQILISRYLSGELSEPEAKLFEEHYFRCGTCFNELRAVGDAMNLIEKEGKSVFNFEDSKDRTKRLNFFRKIFGTPGKMKVNWGIAVSFAIIILAVLITIILTNKEHNIYNNTVAVKKDKITDTAPQQSILEKNPEKELAANLTGPDFAPNQYLEEWSTENVRSVNEKMDKVISPVPGIKIYNKDITFHWLMIQKERVTLKIMTNKEKVVLNKSVANGFPNFTINVRSDIFKHSGLYYWKIEDEDEVLHVGKFYFIKQEH